MSTERSTIQVMHLLTRVAICFAVVGAASGVLVWQKQTRLPDASILPGVRVDGEVVTAEDVDSIVHDHAEKILGRTVELRVEGEATATRRATLRELGVKVDEARAIEIAKSFGHSGDVIGEMDAVELAKNGAIVVPLTTTVDPETVIAFLSPLKDAFDTPPASARMDLENRSVIPEKNGRSLDPWGTIAAIHLASLDPQTTIITIAATSFPPRMSREYVASLDVHSVLSEFETYFSRSGDQSRRGKNIDNAAGKLDGIVISPGEVMSFNAVVGDRNEENGFQKSWEIFKGEMVEGVGGGTCQVASTLHAAAFFGGLDVIERLPHSRPSAYIPMGLDSTVVYPAVDLKLRNIHPFPIVVHARPEGNKLKIQLLGAGKPVKVSFAREVDKTVPYPRKVEEDPRLAGNKVVVKQHGIRGYRIKRVRTEIFDDGRVKKESNTDFYPPTTEIYEVPPGFDVELLPPLPEPASDDEEAPPTPPPTTPVACAGDCPAPTSDVTFVEAPGAHAPTTSQTDPAKTLTLTR